jgi:hypothetical protein
MKEKKKEKWIKKERLSSKSVLLLLPTEVVRTQN